MTLTGWQAVALVFIGAALGLAAVVIPSPLASGLLGIAGSIIGGVLGMFAQRSPQARTRASDHRRDTAAGGVQQITPPPEVFPRR